MLGFPKYKRLGAQCPAEEDDDEGSLFLNIEQPVSVSKETLPSGGLYLSFSCTLTIVLALLYLGEKSRSDVEGCQSKAGSTDFGMLDTRSPAFCLPSEAVKADRLL